jgi:hypothetical protein
MPSRPSEFPRCVAELTQQFDDFITPEKVRNHNGVNIRVSDGIAHHAEVDAASWSLPSRKQTTPFWDAVHDPYDVFRRRNDSELLQRSSVDVDL